MPLCFHQNIDIEKLLIQIYHNKLINKYFQHKYKICICFYKNFCRQNPLPKLSYLCCLVVTSQNMYFPFDERAVRILLLHSMGMHLSEQIAHIATAAVLETRAAPAAVAVTLPLPILPCGGGGR